MEPAVVLLSDDEDRNLHDDKQLESVVIISDDDEVGVESVVVISDDDGDDEKNLNEEELKLEHEEKYSELNNHNDVEKSNISNERVDCVHEGSNELQELSLYECKSYLRKHGMRVSGTKEECIQRIKEHERLKDGKAESLYPISSLSINCTGDACKGDIVLFKQEIKEGVNIVGKRTVVGRILKESYGASSQHTFSVEVLWSKGSKKLNPLSLLLSKGRNFYKFGTLRQPWENEAERSKVLEEKHSRGDAARQKWKLRQTEFASNTNKGAKRQKVSHNGPSQSKCPTQMDKQKPAKRRGAATVKESTTHKRKTVLVAFRKMKFKRSTKLIFRPVLNCNLSPNPNRKWKKNRKLNPNLDSYIYPDHHQQEASSSFPYDGTLVPFGHHRNQQWGLNNVFNQRPGYCRHNYDRPLTRLKSRYPRSSFSIDCTDNACKGDVVLFKCNIYKQGKIVRKKRTIVGRIVEKSYGASNKQHTFMVEVLWTKPTTIKLSPISTLQVKGWKLYKLGTFRQPWKNEAKRSKLLVKKHRRVLAARHKRKLRKTDIASNNNQGAKRQKGSHRGSSQSKQPSQIDKQKYAKRGGAAHVKDCTTHKMKTRSQKKELRRSTQKTFHSDPYQIPDPNLNPNLNPNPYLKSKANPDPKPNSNRDTNPSPNPNLNQSKQPSKTNKQKYAKRQGLVHVKEYTSIHKRVQKKKLKTRPYLNPKLNLKPKANPDPNPNSNRKTNPSPNLKPKANLDHNSSSNRETNPNPNRYVYSDDHLQEASSSFSYHRTPLPNQLPLGFSPHHPPLGFSSNHPPVRFSPNQPFLRFLPNQPPFRFPPYQQPFGFPPNQHPFTFPPNQPQGLQPVLSGYGGQWRHNYAFYQPPCYYSDYNMLTAPSPIISAVATPLPPANQSWMYQHRR